ncbi:MAG: saccharopine dehydrogenase NADP-binding domain-containing protein [Proteobacteria bacterium]|nr:saccharopine dehydrogenase NADP-binding domain-containing protein [Pseudomonadota bacterium]
MSNHRNLLIIGASGGVAGAFLQKIAEQRNQWDRLVLVDQDDGLLRNPFIPHGRLSYEFIKATVDVIGDRASYLHLLKTSGAGVVIDLSINETRPMIEATDKAGVSYVNTGIMNRRGEHFVDVVLDIFRRKALSCAAPHILCAGMNPGVVNIWVREGIERFGIPRAISHFEYGTGQPIHGWIPINTWSRETLLDEIINDPAGYMEGMGRSKELYPNPLKNRVLMKEVLSPVMDLEEYPHGFLLLHEENITIAQRYNVPSRFLFALHPRTMDHLEALYDKEKAVPTETLTLGDNKETPLTGSVTVGVRLEYDERMHYIFNRTPHGHLRGSSGSCWQVAGGLHAAILTLMKNDLGKGIHFMEDLYGTSCERLVRENLPVEEVVIDKGLADCWFGKGA